MVAEFQEENVLLLMFYNKLLSMIAEISRRKNREQCIVFFKCFYCWILTLLKFQEENIGIKKMYCC